MLSESPPAIHAPVNLDRMIACLIEVENSPWNSPGGSLQFTPATWQRFAGKISYKRAQNPAQAKIVAKVALSTYQAILAGENLPSDSYALALCWHYGDTGAVERLRKKIYSDYAGRAENLFNDLSWGPK